MADGIQFTDNRAEVKREIEGAIIAFLIETGGEFSSQAKRNSRIKSGQTAGSWDYIVDEEEQSVTVGSPLENAIWEEFGTGEYALNGDGRKGGWCYVDEHGKKHFTYGKKPNRALYNALETLKPKIKSQMEEKLKGID